MDQPQAVEKRLARSQALCVAARVESAEAGARMLRSGGNAFDAVTAAGFMEAVIAPSMCGIGGYGAAGVAFLAKAGRLVALDANTVAPRAASATMFPVVAGQDPNRYTFPDARHRLGPLSIAVPGVLGGLIALHSNWGQLDRKTVMADAIERARQGVPLPRAVAFSWLGLEAKAEGRPAPRRAGIPAVVKMPALADSLQAIAEEGSAVFYEGRIARAIVEHVKSLGGILTLDDMSTYRAIVVKPLLIDVAGHTLATPPPGSGGLSTLQIVALFERLARSGKGKRAGVGSIFESFLEIVKVVWEERLTVLADRSTMTVVPESLLTSTALDRLFERVVANLDHPGPGRVVAEDPLLGTSQILAGDAEGNLVSWTQTHGGGFGSNVMIKGTGIVMGHGMCRFEPRPKWPNSIAPGKRPLHNLAPVVALKNGKAVLAVGAAGGRTIVNNVASITIGRLLLGLGPAEALAAPRLQCETVEPASLERSAGEAVFKSLRDRGHTITAVARDPGSAELIVREDGKTGWVGAAEPRVETSAAVPA